MAANTVLYERAARVLSVDVEVPWEKVAGRLRAASGKMVVLMHPTPDRIGGILLPDSQKRVRADIGTVVASPDAFTVEGTRVDPPKPGTIVLVHPADGTVIDFEGHKLKAIGAFLGEQEWAPISYPWFESVMAYIEDGNLRPFADKVVIQLDEKHRETEGGILLPDIAQVWRADARIVEAGPANVDDLEPGSPISVDMNLVTTGGLQCLFGKDFERMFVIPPSAINFIYAGD